MSVGDHSAINKSRPVPFPDGTPQLRSPFVTAWLLGEARVRILLVEDDDLVREVTAEMLEEAGYDVLTAASAPDAERLAEKAIIDILITDIVMPCGNGVDLARRLTLRRGGMKTLFTTGYTRHIAPELAGAAILDKPYHRDALLHAIGRLIGFETA